GDESGM
ncbi:EAL domain protein, partial [Vibrio parahaemolyticus VPTS-2010_2]